MNAQTEMTDAEFIQHMRDFSIDHEPEGWPCIKMKDITRLCDLTKPDAGGGEVVVELIEAMSDYDKLENSVKGCSNHGCLIHPPAKGMMGTNAMCSCYRDGMKAQRMMHAGQQLSNKLRAIIAKYTQTQKESK